MSTTEVVISSSDGFNSTYTYFEQDEIELSVYFRCALRYGLIPLISVTGIITNSIIITFLAGKTQKSSTTYLLLGLTIADLISSILGVVITPALEWIPLNVTVKYVIQFLNLPSKISRTLTMITAIERVFSVARPLKFRVMWTPKSGIICVLMAYLVNIALCIFSIVKTMDKGNEAMALTFNGFPLFIVMACNAFTLYKFRTNKNKVMPNLNQQNNSKQMIEKRITKGILQMTGYFIFLNVIIVILLVIYFARGGNPADNVNNLILNISKLCDVLYGTFNCLVLINASKEYREKFLALLHGKCFKRDAEESTSCSNSTAKTGTHVTTNKDVESTGV